MNNQTPKNQGRGMTRPNNHQRGAALEDMLRWAHNQYRANNLAWVWQNGTKAIMRRGQAIFQESLPDFGGVITCMGGRYVSFDAKLIQGAKTLKSGVAAAIRYHHPTDRLHQLRDLWDAQAAGAISFLLVSIDLERYFILWPQASWRDEHPYGVRLDGALEAHQGIEFGRSGSYGLPNWLEVVKEVCK